MATKNVLALLKPLLPSRTPTDKGISQTRSYNPANNATVLTAPTYRDHLTDLYASRAATDSRELIRSLMQLDPDMSAATNAFLTVADTWSIIVARTADGQIDRAGQKVLMSIITALTTRTDYTKGFKVVNSMSAITEACRYMLLMRGALTGELVLNKAVLPSEIRLVDAASIEWYEKTPGAFTPMQRTQDGKELSLDFPTFFATWFRRDPTDIYSKSAFVSSINTIAARQQVINDLYRIMQLTGYPRMEVTVMEEVILKSAPANEVDTAQKKGDYVQTRIRAISGAITNIRTDQAFVHTDAVQVQMLNEKNPAMAVDISKVIEVLNAQNQAGLKTMATILGRGTSGVNTASVEARIFSLNAQSLNEPVGDFLSQILTLALRLTGSESYVEVRFEEVELRSTLELETQKLIRANRFRTDLSDGLITDDEYHLWMYGRLAPEGAELLSGTGFMNPAAGANVDVTDISPNADPLSKGAVATGGNKASRDNKVKNKPTSNVPASK